MCKFDFISFPIMINHSKKFFFSNSRKYIKSEKPREKIILSAINNQTLNTPIGLIPSGSLDQSIYFNIFIALALLGIQSLQLQLTDINFTVFKKDSNTLTQDLSTYKVDSDIPKLMGMGMSFFPALVLCTIDPTKRSQIKIVEINDGEVNRTIIEVIIGFFLVVFYAISIGNLPANDNYIPKIISDSFGQNIKPHDILMNVFNCPLQKLDLKWVLQFPFDLLPDKFKNRLSLSVAGYRILNAFSQCDLKETTPQKVKDLQGVVAQIVKAGPDQNIHPLFRDNKIISKYGSINKSLTGLMHLHAKVEWLNNAVQTKLIYELPRPTPVDQKIFTLDLADFNKKPIDLTATSTQVIDDLVRDLSK